MPTYQTPGVYISENLTPIAATVSGGGNSNAVFVGTCAQGPIVPTLVTSWSQFTALFGGFTGPTNMLPYSVWMYFANGGRQAYIVRAVNANAVAAAVTLKDITAGSPGNGLRVNAIAPGVWGNQLNVAIAPGTTADRFDLTVRYGGLTNTALVEKFPDVSNNPADSRYVVSLVNSPITGSHYINVTDLKVTTASWVYSSAADGLAGIDPAQLITGSDGTGTPDLVAATNTLDTVTGPLTVNLPGVSAPTSATILNSVIAYCENRGTAFLVIDGAQQPAGSTSSAIAGYYTGTVSGGSALTASSCAALYGPWLIVNDPASAMPGAMRYLPPGGAVLGQYALTDATRGVQKAPAGAATALGGVLDLEARFNAADRDLLNGKNVNVIRTVPGSGFCIMGARTLKTGYPDRYVPVRRTLQMLRHDLSTITRFAIFEPNGPDLWLQINAIVTQYLTTLMQTGVLQGSTTAGAFYVQCDSTNNTVNTVNAGIVNLTVGVALQSPAEFIVITISQYEGGTDATTAAA